MMSTLDNAINDYLKSPNKGYHRTIKKAKIKAIGVIECSL